MSRSVGMREERKTYSCIRRGGGGVQRAVGQGNITRGGDGSGHFAPGEDGCLRAISNVSVRVRRISSGGVGSVARNRNRRVGEAVELRVRNRRSRWKGGILSGGILGGGILDCRRHLRDDIYWYWDEVIFCGQNRSDQGSNGCDGRERGYFGLHFGLVCEENDGFFVGFVCFGQGSQGIS